ncbi:MAG TPA: hypothetical protein VIX82_02245 [Solirubrobacteraceae bacterium]
MRRLGLVLACLAVVGVSLLLGGGMALAASSTGCPGSAGDSQYVDPLGCKKTHTTPASPPPTNQTPPPATTTTPQATIASATTTTTTAAHDPSSKGSLPRTGLDVWAAIALGLGLFAAGIAVRRSVPSGG